MVRNLVIVLDFISTDFWSYLKQDDTYGMRSKSKVITPQVWKKKKNKKNRVIDRTWRISPGLGPVDQRSVIHKYFCIPTRNKNGIVDLVCSDELLIERNVAVLFFITDILLFVFWFLLIYLLFRCFFWICFLFLF